MGITILKPEIVKAELHIEMFILILSKSRIIVLNFHNDKRITSKLSENYFEQVRVTNDFPFNNTNLICC